MEDYEFESSFNNKYSALTKRIIRLLSEDSRMSITALANGLGVSRKSVETRLKAAEKELGIKYTVEFDEAKIDLDYPHIILVKFKHKPNIEELRKMLESSYIPQLAIMVKGTYDMLIYANAEDQSQYVYWDKTTQVALAKYGALWEASDLAFRHIGFFPVRSALVEKLKIPQDHKKILLLLNENSRMSFNEMAKRLGMKPNTLAYQFKKMQAAGYVKRFTLVMKRPKGTSMVSVFGKYIIAEGLESDAMVMRKEVTFTDDKIPVISRCLFSAQLIGSYDYFFIGLYDTPEIGEKRLVQYYKRQFRRHIVKTTQGAMMDVLVGDFPIRNIDVKKEFNMIRWLPGKELKIEKYQS